MADVVVKRYAFDDFPASGVEIDTSTERSFLAQLLDTGSGRVVFPNRTTSPAMGDILSFDVKGQRAFASLVRKRKTVTKDQSLANYLTTCEGPGLIGIYGDAPVRPPGELGSQPAADVTLYNYVHPDYDDSGWGSASVICSLVAAQADWGFLATPDAWDPDWLGAAYVDVVGPSDGTSEDAPAGTHHLRDTFTPTFTGAHAVFLGGDNSARLYLNGVESATVGKIGDGVPGGLPQGIQHPLYTTVILTAGVEYTVAMELVNLPPFAGQNPCGVAAAIWIPGYPPPTPPVWVTSSSMKISEYDPEPPGMTVGTVLRLATVDFPFVTLDFDDDVDSNGDPWPFFANISAQPGRDKVLDLIRKLQSGGYADIWMDPNDWILHAYASDGWMPDSGVTLGVGNLTSLAHNEEDTIAQSLLIATDAGGWLERGSGLPEEFLELGGEYTVTEVYRLADSALAALDNPREQREVGLEPDDDDTTPFLNPDFVPGCTITTPDRDGTPTEDRVLEIGCAETKDSERLTVSLTVKDIVQSRNERVIQEVKA